MSSPQVIYVARLCAALAISPYDNEYKLAVAAGLSINTTTAIFDFYRSCRPYIHILRFTPAQCQRLSILLNCHLDPETRKLLALENPDPVPASPELTALLDDVLSPPAAPAGALTPDDVPNEDEGESVVSIGLTEHLSLTETSEIQKQIDTETSSQMEDIERRKQSLTERELAERFHREIVQMEENLNNSLGGEKVELGSQFHRDLTEAQRNGTPWPDVIKNLGNVKPQPKQTKRQAKKGDRK